ncbi:MAG: DUF2911 domain-containing protein [Chitinophagaceae bacterium]|nr:DUF2911 domain-containing protein [Chitinophagaceae bacterium]
MKKLFTGIIALFCITTVQAQVKMPALSPTQFIKQEFGLGSIELTYSRPSLRGRNMIGNIEPWGSVWRTGANAATKITFSDDVTIDGKKIAAGSYAIYTIPDKDGNWTFILNKGVNNWGATGYNEKDDALRMKVKAMKNPGKVETLTMQFSDVKAESLKLNIKWEDVGLQIPISTNITDRIRASIEKALKGDKPPYWQAATFYADYDKNYKKAVEMAEAAFKAQPDAPYYMVYQKAVMQKNAGDKKGALATATKALELAKAAKNENYTIMSEQLVAELK